MDPNFLWPAMSFSSLSSFALYLRLHQYTGLVIPQYHFCYIGICYAIAEKAIHYPWVLLVLYKKIQELGIVATA